MSEKPRSYYIAEFGRQANTFTALARIIGEGEEGYAVAMGLADVCTGLKESEELQATLEESFNQSRLVALESLKTARDHLKLAVDVKGLGGKKS